ncbi:MAG: MobQ family relaxase [Paracoccaceae bacterium]|nr:MobQ family relaxase [Paracoccaceae bacterium]
MASYHLSVSTVSRGRGQSAVAGAAYRAGETLHCEREGVTHDYSRKGGVETAFVLAPSEAPVWASERNALWNAAEGAEGRKNSVVAREWRLALPSELSSEKRVALAEGFGRELVERYGVAVDVAVHAPHREGDDRNWHAHLLTTTREVGSDGFGAKTRVLDAAKTGGVEIEVMRAVWAQAQNQAYRVAGIDASVDHRSLEAQREDALERGDVVLAEVLDREPEPRLGVAATNVERKAAREAAVEGRDYAPVTERGQAVVAIRAIRYEVEMVLADWKSARDRAVSAYGVAREEGAGRIGAAIEAIRAVREPQGREHDGAEDRALERVRAAAEKLKEEDRSEERGDGRNEDDKGIEKRKEPQEERYEEMEREDRAERLAIERNSRDRGFER